ncbi:MAG: VIT and vWA domain-containing protein, partial [Planctomycetota bacterium]
MKSLPMMLAIAGAILLLPGVAAAEPGDETEAGTPTPTQLAELHLNYHTVKVVINNGFATTQVDQILANPKAVAIEAQLAFPLPKEGSLSELSLWIAGEQVVGEVVEKTRAREVYEAEKAAGESSAVAEQNSFYEYRISIARVPAGGEVQARVVYYQPLDIESGVGRYLYPLQEGNTDDMNASFWSMERKVQGDLSFDVTLKTAFPIDGLHSPSHPALAVTQPSEDTWKARFTQPGVGLDKDFVLLYRLRPDVPARVELLTHRRKGEAEGTFMAVVTPGSDLAPAEAGTDWAFVLDVSGSMKGEKIRVLKRGVAKALQGLRPEDRYHLVSFNNSPRALTSGFEAATPQNLAGAGSHIQSLQAGGGTNIFDAIDLACTALDGDRPSALILVSDGVANVGPHQYRDFIEQARRHDVRLFTFVIGNSANERLLGDLATISGGFAKSVSVQDEIGAHLLLARDRMSHQAMHATTVKLEGATVLHPTRLPSLYLGQQLVVFGRYDKVGRSELAVSAKISGKPQTWRVPVELPDVDETNPEIERLYALQAIADLERESWLRGKDMGEAEAAIVDLAVRYSLVTDYTSMVVVRQDRKKAYGIGDRNLERRTRENTAAQRRIAKGNSVTVKTGRDPLAGKQPAHAPTRAPRGGGGGIGGGAVGPLYLLPLAGLALIGLRRRKR